MIRHAATTSAPPEDVWALWSDPPTWPSWTPTMRSVTPIRYDAGRTHESAAAPGQAGVGAAYRIRQPRLPAAVWTITYWTPGRGFTWESTTRWITTVATHRVEPLDAEHGGGTRIEATASWTGPLAPVARLLLGPITRRYVRTEVDQLAAAATGFR